MRLSLICRTANAQTKVKKTNEPAAGSQRMNFCRGVYGGLAASAASRRTMYGAINEGTNGSRNNAAANSSAVKNDIISDTRHGAD